jgi:mersacidin/lichenicidin family type 2 lantibiotic
MSHRYLIERKKFIETLQVFPGATPVWPADCILEGRSSISKDTNKAKETPMSSNNIIRAWKDPNYRNSLSEAERAALPANPAGFIELTDGELNGASGGAKPLPPINPKPRTCNQLCPCVPQTSVARGCTVTKIGNLLW